MGEPTDPRRRQRGQILAVAAVSFMFVVIPMVGLVIDGGYALAQRRASQNASDFGALAGARIVAQWVSDDTANGTDYNVRTAIASAVQANGGAPVVFGSPNGPMYVQPNGTTSGYVGAGTIPPGTVGVTVNSSRNWRPYFLGILGVSSWSAGAQATAKGGYAAGGPSGDLFPAGIAESFFTAFGFCVGPVNTTDPSSPCYPKQLTPGNLNVPGGFGWLKFGQAGKCEGYGLGMDLTDCDTSQGFLQDEVGPPPDSHGCCGEVGQPGSQDKIGSLEGNKVSVDCSYYIDNKVTVTVPVWDIAGGQGTSGYYHIIGFSGFQITECRGGKDIAGVWRRPFFVGPTTSTPGFPGTALAVQLVQ